MRRKKRHITLAKRFYKTSLGVPIKLGYDTVRKANTMQFVGKESKNMDIGAINRFTINLEGEEISETDRLTFSALQYKILIGTLVWIFGSDICKNEFLDKIRNLMWNMNSKRVSSCWCPNKHKIYQVWPWKGKQNYRIITINLENRPHHTISVRISKDSIHATVNLFGSLEVTTCLGKPNFDQMKINENFNVILIVKSNSNIILKMNKEEYVQFKKENKSYKDKIKSLEEIGKEQY